MDVNTTGEVTETVATESSTDTGSLDIGSAVDDIGAGLGFESDESADDSSEGVGEVEAQAASAEPTPSDDQQAAAPAEPAAPAPRTWRPEAAAEWAKLSTVVQAEILKREEDVFKGIESYKADATFGKAMAAAVKPFEQIMQQYNINPAQQINALLNSHYTLAFGSQADKMALLNRMITDYKIDVNAEAPYVDPEVRALREELQSLKSSVQGVNQQREAEVRSTLVQQIDAFSKDPAHADFDIVANDIAAILKSGQAETLQDAYDKAVWLNPVARAKQLERETTARAAQAKKEAEEKLAAVKKATAANVTTRPKSASAATPLGSMDDTLEAVLANIKSRS